MGWRDYVIALTPANERNEIMQTIFEITRTYVTHVTAEDQLEALAKEKNYEPTCSELTITPIKTKLSPKALARIILDADNE